MAEAELQRYLNAARDQLSARVVVVRQLSGVEVDQTYREKFSDFVREQTGDRSGRDTEALMRRLGEERRRLREQRAAEMTKLDDVQKNALGDPVQLPAEAFATTKKAFAALAQELSAQEWLALTVVYAREIQETVKKIKQDAKAAADKPGDAAGKGDTNTNAK